MAGSQVVLLLYTVLGAAGLSMADHRSVCLQYDAEAASKCHSVLVRATNETPRDQGIATMSLLCSAWFGTEKCLMGLLSDCAHVPHVAARYKQDLQDLSMYKERCSEKPMENDNPETGKCYLPFVDEVKTCAADFDFDYFIRIKQKNYIKACRAIEDLLSCVDGVLERVRLACPAREEQLLRTEEVAPFIQETSQFMRANCEPPTTTGTRIDRPWTGKQYLTGRFSSGTGTARAITNSGNGGSSWSTRARHCGVGLVILLTVFLI